MDGCTEGKGREVKGEGSEEKITEERGKKEEREENKT